MFGRVNYNRFLVAMVAEAVERYPDMRFHQILQNLDVSLRGQDQFYEESKDTYKRANEKFRPGEKGAWRFRIMET